MSVIDWSGAIQILFDLPIISDVEIVTGTEYFEIHPAPTTARVPLSSSDYSGYPKTNAFDVNAATYWRANSTAAGQWIGRDFGADVTLTKIVARFDYSSGRPNAYQLQGSANGADWYDVAAGNFANTSGDQVVTFGAATYRYWRLYFTTKYSSYYTCSEFTFWNTRDVYDVAGWSVTADEPLFSPGGAWGQVAYNIRKVTKSSDNLTVTLWLDMMDRVRAPQGDLTIHYNATLGGLLGPGNMPVVSFDLAFTPSGLTWAANPGAAENLTAAVGMTVTCFDVVYKYIPAESSSFLVPDLDNPYMDENLSAYANMTVVVTKVGSLPL